MKSEQTTRMTSKTPEKSSKKKSAFIDVEEEENVDAEKTVSTSTPQIKKKSAFIDVEENVATEIKVSTSTASAIVDLDSTIAAAASGASRVAADSSILIVNTHLRSILESPVLGKQFNIQQLTVCKQLPENPKHVEQFATQANANTALDAEQPIVKKMVDILTTIFDNIVPNMKLATERVLLNAARMAAVNNICSQHPSLSNRQAFVPAGHSAVVGADAVITNKLKDLVLVPAIKKKSSGKKKSDAPTVPPVPIPEEDVNLTESESKRAVPKDTGALHIYWLVSFLNELKFLTMIAIPSVFVGNASFQHVVARFSDTAFVTAFTEILKTHEVYDKFLEAANDLIVEVDKYAYHQFKDADRAKIRKSALYATMYAMYQMMRFPLVNFMYAQKKTFATAYIEVHQIFDRVYSSLNTDIAMQENIDCYNAVRVTAMCSIYENIKYPSNYFAITGGITDASFRSIYATKKARK